MADTICGAGPQWKREEEGSVMTQVRLGLGTNWMAFRDCESEKVLREMATLFGWNGAPATGRLGEVMDAALSQSGHNAVALTRPGHVIVFPAVVSPEHLTALSARLQTEVYAFEAHSDAGLAIMFARKGVLVRDIYDCASTGEFRDFGKPLPGEPEGSADGPALYPEAVEDFSESLGFLPEGQSEETVLVWRTT